MKNPKKFKAFVNATDASEFVDMSDFSDVLISCVPRTARGLAERKSVMAILKAVVVSVPVSNQDRAKAFYVETLGFKLLRDDSSVPGLRWIQVQPPDGGPSLSLVTWFESMPAGCLHGLVFQSSDLDAEHARLSKAGVVFDSPPKKQPWALEMVVRDPDGNRLVIQQA